MGVAQEWVQWPALVWFPAPADQTRPDHSHTPDPGTCMVGMWYIEEW